MNKERQIKCELYNDNFQNYKRYGIQKAQLVIADIPYNIGNNFYGSNPIRNSYGFEVSKEFSNKAKELMLFENNEAKERGE